MPVIYRHIRLDTNEPFYIGIGKTDKRAYSKKSRNKLWNNIVNKTEYIVEILMDNLTWEQACEKEKEFISMYGRKDLGKGTLVNMTDGGDGNNNFSKEVRERISNAHKGNQYGKGWKPTKEQIEKIKIALKGKSNNNITSFKVGHKTWNKGTKGLTKRNITSFSSENPIKAVSVIDISTNKIYKTIREAAKDINVNEKSLYSMLRGRYKNKTNIRYANH
jgi:hypothetical protein